MRFENIAPGMVLYDVHSVRMGNTTARTLGTWTVRVKEIDAEGRRALVSWNGNRDEWYYESTLAKLKDKKPILVRTALGSYRRPTREELKAMREEGQS